MIACFSAEQAERELRQLSGLLVDAVDSGASVGFMPPLSHG
jgi:acetyltransferase